MADTPNRRGGSVTALIVGALVAAALVAASVLLFRTEDPSPAVVADAPVASDTPAPVEIEPAPAPDADTPHEGGPLPPAPPQEASAITRPVWLSRPNRADFAACTPDDGARERAVRVVLACTVNADGTLGCNVEEPNPLNERYERIALCAADRFRMAPRLEDGRATAGGSVRIPLRFQME